MISCMSQHKAKFLTVACESLRDFLTTSLTSLPITLVLTYSTQTPMVPQRPGMLSQGFPLAIPFAGNMSSDIFSHCLQVLKNTFPQGLPRHPYLK